MEPFKGFALGRPMCRCGLGSQLMQLVADRLGSAPLARPFGQVGFALGQDNTHFHVLGGNQSDAVTIARIAKSRLLGARWPTTWPPRLQRLPTMAPADLPTTNNEL